MKIFQDLVGSNSKSYIYSKRGEYSYNHLVQDSEVFCTLTVNRPLVFIVANNSYDCLAGYVGLLRTNAVVALINDSIHESMFNDLIDRFKPRLIYQPQKVFSKRKNWKQRFEKGEYVLYETNIEIDYKLNDDLSLLLMTSGSTGSPEFVRLSHSNLYSNTKAICQYLNIRDSDKSITTLPMSYSYGISIINTHLFMGASLILTDSSIVEKGFWQLITNYEVTTFGGVPYTYEILKKLNFEKIELPSLRYVTQAGGKLSLGLLDYYYRVCTEKQIDFIVMYGQTEASPRMSYLAGDSFFKKTGSIGKALKNCKFELIDEKNKIISKPNKTGEIVFYGDNVSLGYGYSLKDLFLGDVNKKKLFTGDLAYRDKAGFYYIVGRKNRISKIFGIRIDLDEIEKRLEKRGFKVRCLTDDKYLKIVLKNRNNIKAENKIKKIIKNFSGIRENYIFFYKENKPMHSYYFKGLKLGK